jgi:hypothetical protein
MIFRAFMIFREFIVEKWKVNKRFNNKSFFRSDTDKIFFQNDIEKYFIWSMNDI